MEKHVPLFLIIMGNSCTKKPIYATVGLFSIKQLHN